MGLKDQLVHAWNAFQNKDPTPYQTNSVGMSYGRRPDRHRIVTGRDRTIITSIFNRIAMDVAAVSIQHVKLDENGRFKELMKSGLNERLSVEANIDQTGRAFIQDAVLSMLDEGVIALVPVDTDVNPNNGMPGSFEIDSLRVGKITGWNPQTVKVEIYNDKTGLKQEIELPKRMVAIIENPLYAVINEPNGTAKRLARKLALNDAIDEQNSSAKLDLIIQLPYTVKTEAKRKIINERRKEITDQIANSDYGIAYLDSTEHITQLNRSLESNLPKQIEYLTSMLYSQLGITAAVMDGTANEETMINYYNRTIEPILAALADEMKRKFLTKTARTQGQTIMYFRDPFKLAPISNVAEIADKFTRNEIMTSNEFRQVIGLKPSDAPRADELINSNNITQDMMSGGEGHEYQNGGEQDQIVEDLFASLEAQIDEIIGQYTGGGGEAYEQEEPEE